MRARHEAAAESGSAPEGFADVYERYFADIYRYIAGRLGRSVADDIAADTFVIALRKHADFDPGRGPVRAWLYGIATNLVAQVVVSYPARLRRGGAAVTGRPGVDRAAGGAAPGPGGTS